MWQTDNRCPNNREVKERKFHKDNRYNNIRHQPQKKNRDQFECWRCGQFGRRKSYCNVRLDDRKKNFRLAVTNEAGTYIC